MEHDLEYPTYELANKIKSLLGLVELIRQGDR